MTERMQGPNLRWGDPVGTYDLELVEGGAMLTYRARQPNGGVVIVGIPFTTEAVAEMQGLLNLLVFPDELKPDLPNVGIAGHC